MTAAIPRALGPDLMITPYPDRASDGAPATVLLRRVVGPREVPVLSLAGRARSQDLAEAAAAGADESIPMPVSLPRLPDAVERLTGRQ